MKKMTAPEKMLSHTPGKAKKKRALKKISPKAQTNEPFLRGTL